MQGIQKISGQVYVDMYASDAKSAIAEELKKNEEN